VCWFPCFGILPPVVKLHEYVSIHGQSLLVATNHSHLRYIPATFFILFWFFAILASFTLFCLFPFFFFFCPFPLPCSFWIEIELVSWLWLTYLRNGDLLHSLCCFSTWFSANSLFTSVLMTSSYQPSLSWFFFFLRSKKNSLSYRNC
jgi:hypothetical protein